MTEPRLRPRAEQDLVERTRYYRRSAGDEVGERFFDAAIAILADVERMPGIGSPRVGEICDIPGLRFMRVPGFPCGWIYFSNPSNIDIVRLLADSQDLTTILSDVEPEDP